MTGGPRRRDAPRPPDREEALALYRRMRLIRRFEDSVQSLFQQGDVHGTTHLYSGQEAVRRRRLLGARAARTASPAPTAATGTRWRSASSPQALLDELLGPRDRASAAAAPAR